MLCSTPKRDIPVNILCKAVQGEQGEKRTLIGFKRKDEYGLYRYDFSV